MSQLGKNIFKNNSFKQKKYYVFFEKINNCINSPKCRENQQFYFLDKKMLFER